MVFLKKQIPGLFAYFADHWKLFLTSQYPFRLQLFAINPSELQTMFSIIYPWQFIVKQIILVVDFDQSRRYTELPDSISYFSSKARKASEVEKYSILQSVKFLGRV